MMKLYADYEITDFLLDESFRDWVRSGKVNHDFPDRVLAECPEKAALLQEAADIARLLPPVTLINDQEACKRSWEQIEARTRGKSHRVWWAAAASVMVLVVAGYWYKHTTKIQLPDATEIVLGKQGKVSYPQKWAAHTPREVWLEGDAAFHVTHLHKGNTAVKPEERFLVHMAGNITVEVLGTVFTVDQEKEQTKIALESGSIKVWKNGIVQSIMQPGETLTIPKGQLHMQQMKVRDILAVVEKNYGKKIVVNDTVLLEKQVDGMLPLTNEAQAMKALASILDVELSQHHDTLWMHHIQP